MVPGGLPAADPAVLLVGRPEVPPGTSGPTQRTHAHPFAHTENYFPSEQPRAAYDPQVIKPAFTHVPSSSFLSKTCLLRYFEEEVEFNDICHFRVEPEVGSDPLFYLEVSLLFFNQQVKKIEPEEITVENGRVVKTKRYLLRNCREGLHESVQVVFDGQYFSVGSVGVHAVGLDYRMRLSGLQLAEFSRLTQAEKRKLLERSKKMQGKPPSYLQALTAQLKAGNQVAALQMAEEQLLKGIKRTHQALLKEYGILFSRVLTEQHKTNFSHLLVHPSQLGLFE